MTWTRLSDDFTDRVDVMNLSDAAFRLHMHALVWSNRSLSDGLIPMKALHRIAVDDSTATHVEALCTAGLWQAADGGYQVEWKDQEPAERVKIRRGGNADRQRAYRDRMARHEAGDHSTCTSCNALRDTKRGRGVTPPLPNPSRPSRSGTGVCKHVMKTAPDRNGRSECVACGDAISERAA